MPGRIERAAIAAWAGFGLTAAAGPVQAQEAADSSEPTAEQIAGRCEEVLTMAPQMVRDRRFASMPGQDKETVLGFWATCAMDLGELHSAYEALGMLAPIATEPVPIYIMRMSLAARFGEAAEALEAFNAVVRSDPEVLSSMPLRAIGSLLNQVSSLSGGDDVTFDILETLDRNDYVPPDPLSSDEGLRVMHARLLLERDRSEDAMRRLGDPLGLSFSNIVTLSAERLFDPLLAELEPIDFVAAAERRIDEARSRIAGYPRLLQMRYRYIQTLRDAGRNAEALEEADRVPAEIADVPDAFDDKGEYLNWIHNDRAYALYALGECRQARAAMQSAAQADEHGNRNVSQVINRGMLLVRETMAKRLERVHGRPEVQEALAKVGRSREIPLPLAYWGGRY